MTASAATVALLGPGLQRAYELGASFGALINHRGETMPETETVTETHTDEHADAVDTVLMKVADGTLNAPQFIDAIANLVTEWRKGPEMLSSRASQEFRRSLAHMRFAADPRVTKGELRMGSYRDPLPVSTIRTTLDALNERLVEYVDEHNALERAHNDLVADVRAARRVFGVDRMQKDTL